MGFRNNINKDYGSIINQHRKEWSICYMMNLGQKNLRM